MKIYKVLPSTLNPIMVRNTLAVYEGLTVDTRDVGTLCTNANNMFARYKPIKYATVNNIYGESGTDMTIPKLAKYSINIPILNMGDIYTGGTPSNELWTYVKPSGGDASPYRLLDFMGYTSLKPTLNLFQINYPQTIIPNSALTLHLSYSVKDSNTDNLAWYEIINSYCTTGQSIDLTLIVMNLSKKYGGLPLKVMKSVTLAPADNIVADYLTFQFTQSEITSLNIADNDHITIQCVADINETYYSCKATTTTEVKRELIIDNTKFKISTSYTLTKYSDHVHVTGSITLNAIGQNGGTQEVPKLIGKIDNVEKYRLTLPDLTVSPNSTYIYTIPPFDMVTVNTEYFVNVELLDKTETILLNLYRTYLV